MKAPFPHWVDERESDMRAIKQGWYAMDGNGKLSLGPCSTPEDCARKIGQSLRLMP
jgi:hypothetical protein